jgi:hypothetical protein
MNMNIMTIYAKVVIKLFKLLVPDTAAVTTLRAAEGKGLEKEIT